MDKIYTSLEISIAGTPFKKSNGPGRSMSVLVLLLISSLFSFGQTLTQSGFVSIITPKYMANGDGTRLPVMFRATVTGLTANTTYRYYNQAATNSSANGGTVDIGSSNPGAGNPLLISAGGATYTYTSSPSLTSAGNFSTFTTDATGDYTGWFGFVNTGNGRFNAGNLIFPSIVIGNNATGAVIARRALDVSIQVLAFSTSAGANNGSFLKEVSSNATAKNLVAIYDNVDGTGRPVFVAPVNALGTTIASLIPAYSATAGSWNAIMPNNNPNGIRRIEQLSVANGTIIGCVKDEDGIWPTGSVSTVNPNAGTTGRTIAAADASLTTCITCGTITVTADAGIIACPGGTTTVNVTATGGTAPYTGTGSFTVGAGSFTYSVTDANGCPGATSIVIAAPVDTTKPVIYLQGSSLLAGVTGPSTSVSPYLKSSLPGIKFNSIFSVNDVTTGGYRMVGIPDGLGAFDNGNGTFTILLNHELTNTVGIARAHGSKGSFVSKWIVNKSDLSVTSGSDLMQQVFLWNPSTSTYAAGTTAFSRFCSADLPPVSAFYNSATGLGTKERIFMNGEESGDEGRAVGHIVTGAAAGVSYELPYLGKFSWENSVASGASGNKTVVAGMDDGNGGQVYIYVGTKTNAGTDIDKAGLSGGKLYGVKVVGLATETSGGVPAPGTRFELFDQGLVQNTTGVALNAASVANGVTTFLRPEDGAWDPQHPNDFYFATTNAFASPTRLWRLRFDNVQSPETGGTIEAVLDGSEGGRMFDNIAIDKFGKVTLVEDVGNNAHIGKVWQYNLATDALVAIAHHDSTRFLVGAPNFLTQDEEASGVLDVSEILGPGMFLTDVQAHYTPGSNATEVVEGGQLLAYYNPHVFGTSTAADTIRAYAATGCTAKVNLGTPSAADDCGVANLTNNAPASFEIGTTIVTWTATDASGNTATASQVVLVSDTTAPTIIAPAAVNVSTNEGCTAAGINLGTPATADNCAVDSVYNNAPVAFPIGTTTVTWTVTDTSGNSATATQQVIVSDTAKPVIYLQSSALLAGITGPSTSISPYLKPSLPGIRFKSMLAVNDVIGGYRMVGIPDGLGAFDNGNGTFTILLNHELTNTVGIARAHGSKGSFVSKWIVNKSDLSIVSGSDLMQQLFLWNPATSSYSAGTTAFSRFCSADLPPVSAFYNSATGLGTKERIFMDGEESGDEGRAVGHIVTGAAAGVSYELPYLGKFSWENSVASGGSGNKTVVAGMDDGNGGQVYIYVGTKTNSGTDIDKAGLSGGKLYGVKVVGLPTETSGGVPAPGTRFELFDHGFVQNTTGVALNASSVANGVTTFLRPEDGAWDPLHPNDFYFATTNAFASPTRLWRLRFDNVQSPETGGIIEAVLDGTEGGRMFDNITVDKFGKVTLVEDVGNNAHIGKVWQYDLATDALVAIAHHDSTRFLAGAPNFLTQDEEASGVLDVSEILGPGMFLTDVQAHYTPGSNATEVVEGGQLLAYYNPYVFGTSTAPDTIRVNITSGTSTTVNLGTPATADNCTVASLTNDAPGTFPIGTTVVTWTATDGSGNTATASQMVIVTLVANTKPTITITSPLNNSTYFAGVSIPFNASATDADGSIVKVDFYVDSTKIGTDSTSAYQIMGQQVGAGVYKLKAVAFDNSGDSTVSDTVHLTIAGCSATGSIYAEGYNDISGSQVSDLTGNPSFPGLPSVTAHLGALEYGPNLGDSYGARVRGYICAPATGYYTFYIAADDQAGLWLSTDDNSANKVLIAYTASPTGFRTWNANPSQQSAPVYLIKGVRYYVETLHKEAVGQDHLSVAWLLPGGVFEAPIAGTNLSPITSGSGGLVSGAAVSFADAMKKADEEIKNAELNRKDLQVTVRPNPSTTDFTLVTKAKSNDELTIIISDAAGRVTERKTNVPANGTLKVGNTLRPGVYFIEAIQGSRKVRLKVVKQ
jgi:hypothetical protein